jgi:hypothetical protein
MDGVALNNNVATISIIPSGTQVSVTTKTNSNSNQRVTITDGGNINLTFTGSGERNTVIGQSNITSGSTLQITFTFDDGSGQWRNS